MGAPEVPPAPAVVTCGLGARYLIGFLPTINLFNRFFTCRAGDCRRLAGDLVTLTPRRLCAVIAQEVESHGPIHRVSGATTTYQR